MTNEYVAASQEVNDFYEEILKFASYEEDIGISHDQEYRVIYGGRICN